MPEPVETFVRPAPRWKILGRDHEAESYLRQTLGISKVLAALLVQRGFRNPGLAEKFLNPNLDDLGNPHELPDYKSASEAILGARERNELIFVHGDYDVDGITSSAILDRFLKSIGCNVHTHVPHRIKEGYGIHLHAVDHAHELGAKLFLTCDCGIAAHEQVNRARSLGMAVVVTDHHQIAETIPEAQAVVNPHRKDSQYPERELSGAGVVFRLCEGLTADLGYPVDKFRRSFLDLACLGTIADVMPLVGENRIIAKFGLEQLQATKKVGLQALMRSANVGQDPDKPVGAYNVGWHLGPRLNAAGRLEDAATALRLLIERDERTADELAQSLEAVNTDRRTRTAEAFEEASEMVISNRYYEQSMIVVVNPSWHPGIVGIVAGRLVERFCRPALVVTADGSTGLYRGSARSVSNFHLADAIWSLPDLLKGGGHAMAAGCSFKLENLDAVRAGLNELAESRLTKDDLIPQTVADLEVEAPDLDDKTVEELSRLEPFGTGNPQPIFCARSVIVDEVLPTRNPSHVRLTLAHQKRRRSGIGFQLGERFEAIGAGANVDLLFHAEINVFRNNRSVQWQVKDVREALGEAAE